MPAVSESGQSLTLQGGLEPVILVARGHDHFRPEKGSGGQRFPGEKIQPAPWTIELASHGRRHLAPAEHLDFLGQFQ
jgi:hypothetical protein